MWEGVTVVRKCDSPQEVHIWWRDLTVMARKRGIGEV